MTRVIIVRHGQTEWNRVERFRGRADLRLNETGYVQASLVARRLAAAETLAALYSSPLLRAMQTAAPIAKACGVTTRPLDGLIDIDYGEWQGLTPEEVAARYPALYRRWEESPQLVAIPGGESLAAVRARAEAALRRAVAEHEGGTVALVTHKVVCKLLVCAALGIPDDHFWQIEQDNGALDVVEFGNGRPVLKLCNDTCHLA